MFIQWPTSARSYYHGKGGTPSLRRSAWQLTHAFQVCLLWISFTVWATQEWIDCLKGGQHKTHQVKSGSEAVSFQSEVKAQLQCRCLIRTNQLVRRRWEEECLPCKLRHQILYKLLLTGRYRRTNRVICSHVPPNGNHL